MKIKMKNLGVMRPKSPMVSESKQSQKPSYPTLNLSTKHFPDIANAQRGKKHKLTFEAHCTGTENGEDYGTDKGARATFELRKGTMGDPEEMAENTTDQKAEGKKGEVKEKGYKNISEASFGARKEDKS